MYSGKMENGRLITKYVEPIKGNTMVTYEEALNWLRNIVVDAHGMTPQDLNLGLEDIAEHIDPEVVITPTYMTDSAVGADVFASEDTVIEPGDVTFVKTGIKANFDSDLYGLFPFIRSSLPKKKGLMLANGVGVIEQDYYSNPDNDGEICFMFYNFRSTPATIKRFERIGQLVILPIIRFDNASHAGKERGASGSTGN